MKINNLVTVKGYTAGENGCLLVSLDENFTLNHVNTFGGILGNTPKEYDIRGDASVWMVPDGKALEWAESKTDDNTPANFIIVVSPRFMKLSNKSQLILLERENVAARKYYDSICKTENTNITDGLSLKSCVIAGDLAAMEKYGAMRASWTIRKEQKRINSDEIRAGKHMHRAYKKGKAAESFIDEILGNNEEENSQGNPQPQPTAN